jgi:hypothetical protein
MCSGKSIGIAAGLEHYVLAVGSMALVLVVLRLLLLVKDDLDVQEDTRTPSSSVE